MYLSLKYRFYAMTTAGLVFSGLELLDAGQYFGLIGLLLSN